MQRKNLEKRRDRDSKYRRSETWQIAYISWCNRCRTINLDTDWSMLGDAGRILFPTALKNRRVAPSKFNQSRRCRQYNFSNWALFPTQPSYPAACSPTWPRSWIVYHFLAHISACAVQPFIETLFNEFQLPAHPFSCQCRDGLWIDEITELVVENHVQVLAHYLGGKLADAIVLAFCLTNNPSFLQCKLR